MTNELTDFQKKCKAVSHHREMTDENTEKPPLDEINLREELPDDVLSSLYSEVVMRCCMECLGYDYYRFNPGYNSRYDCRQCGAEAVIQT